MSDEPKQRSYRVREDGNGDFWLEQYCKDSERFRGILNGSYLMEGSGWCREGKYDSAAGALYTLNEKVKERQLAEIAKIKAKTLEERRNVTVNEWSEENVWKGVELVNKEEVPKVKKLKTVCLSCWCCAAGATGILWWCAPYLCELWGKL